MEPQILFQDESILVLDKSAGWIVNESNTTKGQNVLQFWLSKLDYLIAKSLEFRSGIVHRLDKETSGIIVIAKTKEAFTDLQGQFKDRLVKKTYIALVHGIVEPKEGVIEAPVGRLPWRRDRFGVLPGGREATTEYKTINQLISKSVTNEKYTLLELYPGTGRTHQIRIHLKYIGHPVVADEFYAGRKTARRDRIWCPRLFLHASQIKFLHPKTKQLIKIESKLPDDLTSALEKLTSVVY